VRRIRWEAREFALQHFIVRSEIYRAGKSASGGKGETPKKGGIMSAEAFLSGAGE
jgi:hypothetical protein